MPRSLRRLTAFALLVWLAPAAHAAAACAGWSGSAAERMACCQKAGAGCQAVSSDSCCAEGEQRQNVSAVAVLYLPAPAGTIEPLVIPVTRPASPADDPRSLAERPATYLLDSVFRI